MIRKEFDANVFFQRASYFGLFDAFRPPNSISNSSMI